MLPSRDPVGSFSPATQEWITNRRSELSNLNSAAQREGRSTSNVTAIVKEAWEYVFGPEETKVSNVPFYDLGGSPTTVVELQRYYREHRYVTELENLVLHPTMAAQSAILKAA
jgi:hypothetical protein